MLGRLTGQWQSASCTQGMPCISTMHTCHPAKFAAQHLHSSAALTHPNLTMQQACRHVASGLILQAAQAGNIPHRAGGEWPENPCTALDPQVHADHAT